MILVESKYVYQLCYHEAIYQRNHCHPIYITWALFLLLLVHFDLSAGQFNPAHSLNDAFSFSFQSHSPSLTIPPNPGSIGSFPTVTSPQFGMANYFSPMVIPQHQFPSSIQSFNPTLDSLWNPSNPQGQPNHGSGESRIPARDTDQENSETEGETGTQANGGEVTLSPQTVEHHEKKAEKNTESVWKDAQPTTERRFGLLTKLWRKKKAKIQSNKHKHDHFHHQSVHHHHHHHHYHHHIHHYPNKKPNSFKSAVKKFKYKLKFKSKVKEIGEAPPTQSIYDQPAPIYHHSHPAAQPVAPYSIHHLPLGIPAYPNNYW